MLPKVGMSVKLRDAYIARNSQFNSLSGVKLTVANVMLKGVTTQGVPTYEFLCADPNGVHYKFLVDNKGADSNSIIVFESYINVGSPNPIPIIHSSDEEDSISVALQPPVISEPKNNDGRTNCFWCKSKTKRVDGAFSSYDICTNPACGR